MAVAFALAWLLAGCGGDDNVVETCAKCHTKKLGVKKPNRACETCHAGANKHKKRFTGINHSGHGAKSRFRLVKK